MRRLALVLLLSTSLAPLSALAQDEDAGVEGEPVDGEGVEGEGVEGEGAEGEGAEGEGEAVEGEAVESEAEGETEEAPPEVEAEPTEPEGPQPLPAAEIGRRIEETFRQLQEVMPRLHRSREMLSVRRRLPNFVASISLLEEDPALGHLETLHPASLHDHEQEWSRVRQTLLQWQEQLETRSAALSEERTHVADAHELWMTTREAPREEPLPESQVVRIDSLIHRIDTVLRRIDRRLEEVLALQGELSDQGIRVARQMSRIEAAQSNARARRQRRDHRPLWRGWSPTSEEEELQAEAPDFGEVANEHAASMQAFLLTEKKAIAWHTGSFVVFALFFVFLRVRTKSSLKRTRPSAHRGLRARPFASALLLVLILTPIVYRYVPVVAVGVTLVVMAPAIYLLSRQMLPTAHADLLALLVLAAISVPLSLGVIPESVRRFYVLLVQIAGLVFAAHLSAPRWRTVIADAPRVTQRLYGLLRLMVVPHAVALYLLLNGYTERAELWTTGTFWATEQALGLFLGVELLVGLLEYALRQPWARFFYTVRDRRRRVQQLLTGALRWTAIGCFFYLALTSFDLLDPTLEASRLIFRRTFEFGSIELSFGDVLAFLAMLFGTFLVMRLVHVLLELEILPRFDLEQGIASAISLSVSYVLVAIGVVLAFGVAGVGPERLALLGGALGVGIGFGLQNVVSNFVSGLILVAERPIKVGDIIEVGGDLVGTVKRIGIRSSTVHSLNGAEVIVPNADLISGQLINWTLSDAKRRLELVVGAGYQHDPADVMRVLTRVVRTQAGVLNDPPPDVICTSFGDSAIEYTLRAWTPGYLEAIRTKSALAARVHATLGREDIEIPFPQTDLNVRSISDEAAKALAQPSED